MYVTSDVAVAPNPKNCTTCRACLERFPGRVAVDKVKDYFICKIKITLNNSSYFLTLISTFMVASTLMS